MGGAVGLALAVIAIAAHERRVRGRATRRFREAYHPAGKDLLLVYSASPHWQPIIEEEWIPRWAARAVLLNRSTPRQENTPEESLWRAWTGDREHTPVAIVVPEQGTPVVVPFFLAFRDRKHGKDATLARAVAALEVALPDRRPGEH